MQYIAQPDVAVFFYKDGFEEAAGWVKARSPTPRSWGMLP